MKHLTPLQRLKWALFKVYLKSDNYFLLSLVRTGIITIEKLDKRSN